MKSSLTLISNNPLTMSSLEMVDYINAERKAKADAEGVSFPCKQYRRLSHKNFMAKVPKVLGDVHSAKFLAQYKDSTGRELPCYELPKREACLMAMSYSYELQARVLMRQNPIDVLYRSKDNADPNAADTLMVMYRTDMCHNTAKIAINMAVCEQIEADVGAWRLVTDYEDQDPTSNSQVIRRLPIHEAASHVIWDSNARQMDKSDARHITIINAMTLHGWKAFADENGSDPDVIPDFQDPDTSWLFPWLSKDVVYVGEFYEVEEKKETVFIQDPLTGEPVSYFKRDIADALTMLTERGYENHRVRHPQEPRADRRRTSAYHSRLRGERQRCV